MAPSTKVAGSRSPIGSTSACSSCSRCPFRQELSLAPNANYGAVRKAELSFDGHVQQWPVSNAVSTARDSSFCSLSHSFTCWTPFAQLVHGDVQRCIGVPKAERDCLGARLSQTATFGSKNGHPADSTLGGKHFRRTSRRTDYLDEPVSWSEFEGDLRARAVSRRDHRPLLRLDKVAFQGREH